MELTLLGTGNAAATACFNTCFVLRQGEHLLLVDGGGGNQLLRQLQRCQIPWQQVREIFVTHKHLDHIGGILWMMRMICQGISRGSYTGGATIYSHPEVLGILRQLAGLLLPASQARLVGDRLRLAQVADGQRLPLLDGRQATFFDIRSTKATQFGFSLELKGGGKLTCCGDEPCGPAAEPYAQGSRWLLHEAFCLASQAERFRPYEKHHSTVADACRLAGRLQVENLVLYHTEDENLPRRKQLYTQEGARYFTGGLFIPDDLETIPLDAGPARGKGAAL